MMLSTSSPRTEIVFVFDDLSNWQQLLADAPPGAEVVVLDGSGDGLAQIADRLQDRSGIDAIHLLSHGKAGAFKAGDRWIDTSSLASRSALLERIGAALDADGDILLYGCKSGEGEVGALMVEEMARLTQADVAASDDNTGSAQLGGDWALERATGPIETAALSLTGYAGLLAVTTATNLNQTKLYIEDAASVALDDIVVSGPDGSDTITAQVTLADPSFGSLTSSAGSYNQGTGVWSYSAPLTQMNAALAALAFVPAANNDKSTTLVVRIRDAFDTGPADGTIVLSVTPVNDVPGATHDAITVAEDSGATVIDVLANDSSAPDTGETLTVVAVTQPAVGGSVSLVGGVVSFSPNANWFGNTAFIYTISDGNGGISNATVNVTVVPVNDAPDAINDTITVAKDSGATVIDVLANDSSAPDIGETLTVTSVTQPAVGGSVSLVGGVVSFTPHASWFGNTAFTYTISDGYGGTDTAIVNVSVMSPNNAPDASNDTITVAEDSGATVINVLANDSSAPDIGETLTVTAVTQPIVGGSVGLVGGVVSFTPNANWFGNTAFTYTISDGNGGTDTATVNITVTSVNDVPQTIDQSKEVDQNNSLSGQIVASDADGDQLTYVIQSGVMYGSVQLSPATGAYTYTPHTNYHGADSFTIRIYDPSGSYADSVVSIVVKSLNRMPTATDDSVTVVEDSGSTVIDVLANDSSAPDIGETLTVTAVTQPIVGGSVGLVGGVVSFTPNANWFGNTAFTYTISDGNGGTDTATVNVTVTPVNDAPTDIGLSTSSVAENTSTVSVLTIGSLTTTDADTGDTFSYSIAGGADQSHFEISGNNLQFKAGTLLNYEVKNSYSVVVRTTDAGSASYDKTLTVALTDRNDAPTVAHALVDQSARASQAFQYVFASNSFADEDVGQVLTYTATQSGGVALPSWLTFTPQTRTFSGTPASGDVGTLTIQVVAGDGNGGTVTDHFALTVTAPSSPTSPSSPAPEPADGNGIPQAVENAVPGLSRDGRALLGDGNGDGVLDSLQAAVASVAFQPVAGLPGAGAQYLTLVAASRDGIPSSAAPAALGSLRQLEVPADKPAGLQMPLGLLSFSASIASPGGSETFSLFSDESLGASGYWKQDGTGAWVNLASAAYGGGVVREGGKIRLDFQLTDGGEFDRDGIANGVIADPGAIGWRDAAAGDSDGDGVPDVLEGGQGLVVGLRDNDVPGSDGLFIRQLYRDLLGREADPDGLAFWRGALEDGRIERADMVRSMLDASEVENGAGALLRLFLGAFGRPVDDPALAYWLDEWRAGVGLTDIAGRFVQSDAFQQRYGAADDAAFVASLYQNVLGRSADAQGAAFWQAQLSAGASRGEVLLGFTDSSPFHEQSAAEVDLALGYLALLARTPDKAGLQYWSQTPDPESLIRGALGSEEYLDRFAPEAKIALVGVFESTSLLG